jgi:hypothetical protein
VNLLWIPAKILLFILIAAIVIVVIVVFAIGAYNAKGKDEVEDQPADKKKHAKKGDKEAI